MHVSLNPNINYCNYKCQNNTCFGMQKRQATKFRELVEQQEESKNEPPQMQISDLQIFHLQTNQNCSLASSKSFQSGGRRFGSKEINAPASFAMPSAFFVAIRIPSCVIESVPKWNIFD